jgi:hypothetical protein
LLKLRFFLSVLHLGVPREAAEDVGELWGGKRNAFYFYSVPHPWIGLWYTPN